MIQRAGFGDDGLIYWTTDGACFESSGMRWRRVDVGSDEWRQVIGCMFAYLEFAAVFLFWAGYIGRSCSLNHIKPQGPVPNFVQVWVSEAILPTSVACIVTCAFGAIHLPILLVKKYIGIRGYIISAISRFITIGIRCIHQRCRSYQGRPNRRFWIFYSLSGYSPRYLGFEL